MVTMTFVAASAKFAQLVPLLVQWNSASSPKSDFIRCYNFGELLAPRGKLDNTGKLLTHANCGCRFSIAHSRDSTSSTNWIASSGCP
jgi:hypothetical protein